MAPQRRAGGACSSSSSAWVTAVPSSCWSTWFAIGDRDRFDYEVAYILEDENSLVPQLDDAGVPVHSLGAASNRDLGWTLRLRALLRQGDFDRHAFAPALCGDARADGGRGQH